MFENLVTRRVYEEMPQEAAPLRILEPLHAIKGTIFRKEIPCPPAMSAVPPAIIGISVAPPPHINGYFMDTIWIFFGYVMDTSWIHIHYGGSFRNFQENKKQKNKRSKYSAFQIHFVVPTAWQFKQT